MDQLDKVIVMSKVTLVPKKAEVMGRKKLRLRQSPLERKSLGARLEARSLSSKSGNIAGRTTPMIFSAARRGRAVRVGLGLRRT